VRAQGKALGANDRHVNHAEEGQQADEVALLVLEWAAGLPAEYTPPRAEAMKAFLP
jgi:hypothetical protein